jgi:hypothetical protein
MHNVFVGALCAVALFFWAYRGYKREEDDKKIDIGDNRAGNLADLYALGVAFFPTYIGHEDLTLCIIRGVFKKSSGNNSLNKLFVILPDSCILFGRIVYQRKKTGKKTVVLYLWLHNPFLYNYHCYILFICEENLSSV